VTLLETVRGLLERSYRMETGLAGIGAFVVGDRGYRALDGAPSGGGARTLVRQTDDGVRAAIYFPDELIARLEHRPPQRGIGDENVDDFATFVEEVDHLLVLAERSATGRPLSLFELELHANVSKHLVLARFLAGRAARALSVEERLWLRHHLFDKNRYSDEDETVRARYRDARRWALRLLDALSDMRRSHRIDALRAFHAAGAGGKLELIARVA
jgi:hypothetical protein